MKVLSQKEAELVLRPMGLCLGQWNELKECRGPLSPFRSCRPPSDAHALFTFSEAALDWVGGGWLLVQFDNSMSPTDHDVRLVSKLIHSDLRAWDVAKERAVFIENSPEQRATAVLLCFFGVLFHWHFYLVAEMDGRTRRLAVQDGVVHFIGDEAAIASSKVPTALSE